MSKKMMKNLWSSKRLNNSSNSSHTNGMLLSISDSVPPSGTGSEPSTVEPINSVSDDDVTVSEIDNFDPYDEEFFSSYGPESSNGNYNTIKDTESDILVSGASILCSSKGEWANLNPFLVEISRINGKYLATSGTEIPTGFQKVCDQGGWNAESMWLKLNGSSKKWYKHADSEKGNDSSIYYNAGTKKWWIDGPSGYGVFLSNPTTLPHAACPVGGWKYAHEKDMNEKIRVIPPLIQPFTESGGKK